MLDAAALRADTLSGQGPHAEAIEVCAEIRRILGDMKRAAAWLAAEAAADAAAQEARARGAVDQALAARLKKVMAWDDRVSRPVADGQAKIRDLYKEYKDAIAKDWTLVEAKGLRIRAGAADHKAVTQALAMTGCTPTLAQELKTLLARRDACDQARQARDFAAAGTVLARLIASAGAMIALKAEHDANKDARRAVEAAYDKISALVDAAPDRRPLTETLAEKKRGVDKAVQRFFSACDAFDHAVALTRLAPLDAAAREVEDAADIPDAPGVAGSAYDVAMRRAQAGRAAAADTIRDADPAVLGALPNAGKLALLDRQRATREPLTPEPRALQSKLYEALTVPSDFKELDDERRDALVERIAADQDLMAARADGDPRPVEERLPLTLETECEIPACRFPRSPPVPSR